MYFVGTHFWNQWAPNDSSPLNISSYKPDKLKLLKPVFAFLISTYPPAVTTHLTLVLLVYNHSYLRISVLKYGTVYFIMCPKYCWMSNKQCRPWSNAAFCSIWCGSTLYAHACMSRYLGLLQYLFFWFTKSLFTSEYRSLTMAKNMPIKKKKMKFL